MATMKWTPAQQVAIDDRGGALLVSAAAGSGKTAVLTERVVQLLQDAQTPIQADRLLIVTFTNAAAAELRARIAARLEQALVEQPYNNHLRRQKMLLQRAHICTIDALCLQLVQQHFTALDVPPDFSLADAGAVEKQKGDALAQTLEQAYQNPAFCDFANLYGKGRADGAATAAVLQLYAFLRTVPDPAAFEQLVLAQYSPAAQGKAGGMAGVICEAFRAELAEKMQLGIAFAKDALTLCETDFEEAVAKAIASKKTPAAQQKAEAKVTERFEKLFALLQAQQDLLAALAQRAHDPHGWDSLYETLAPYRTGQQPLPALKGSGIRLSGGNAARVRQTVERASALLEKALALVPCTLAQDAEDRALALPMITALYTAQKQFATLFYQKKIEKKMLEFADLEHLTLALLAPQNGARTPLAQSIAAGFDAVMVDEYQDTNALQDLIYQRLANEAGDNLFYVGDMKQSIYRFRHADPSIFADKLKHFAPLYAGQARPAPAAKHDTASVPDMQENASGAQAACGTAAQHGASAQIALDANFRSCEAVVGGVNFIFEAIMSPRLGGVAYGDGQRLVCQSGSSFAGSTSLLLDVEGGQDPAQIAAKIKQLIALGAAGDAAGMVRDGDALRPMRYEDCCILLSTRAPFAQYAKALAEQGIAVYADSAEDLLSASHIQPLVALLNIIDNPAQDIPLAAAMLSIIFGFTEDDLLTLRHATPKGSLYGAIIQVAGLARTAQMPDAFGQKILAFYQQLSALRRVSHTLAPEELLAEIFATTHYLALVGAMENGARRREDVAKFAAYVATAGGNGIESLVHHIAQTKASGGLVETAPGRAKPGCVTIMTIHRSKGLQFPAVFVANMNHRFNTDDLKKKMLLHPTLGLGLQLRAGAQGGNYHTLDSTYLMQVEKQEIYSEQMRLLYVALTRAQDHLYLCGSAASYEKHLQSLAFGMEGQLYAATQHEDCMGATSFLDWVLRALLCHPSCGALREGLQDVSLNLVAAAHPIAVTLTASTEDAEGAADGTQNADMVAGDCVAVADAPGAATVQSDTVLQQNAGVLAAPDGPQPAVPDLALVQQYLDGFAWQYPRAALTALPSKVSVTALVHQSARTTLSRPAFLAKDGMTAAEKGTALHAFLENADFDTLKTVPRGNAAALQAALQAEVARQLGQQSLAPVVADALDMPSVTAFFEGEAFARIAGAQAIYREYDFITGLPAAEVLASAAGEQGLQLNAQGGILRLPMGQGAMPVQGVHGTAGSDVSAADLAVGAGESAQSLPEIARDATVLVQGIADLLLVYPDHLELLDYKSDHRKKEADYRASYAQQLAYYAKAIEKRFAPLPMTYKAIYSFDLGKLIEV